MIVQPAIRVSPTRVQYLARLYDFSDRQALAWRITPFVGTPGTGDRIAVADVQLFKTFHPGGNTFREPLIERAVATSGNMAVSAREPLVVRPFGLASNFIGAFDFNGANLTERQANKLAGSTGSAWTSSIFTAAVGFAEALGEGYGSSDAISNNGNSSDRGTSFTSSTLPNFSMAAFIGHTGAAPSNYVVNFNVSNVFGGPFNSALTFSWQLKDSVFWSSGSSVAAPGYAVLSGQLIHHAFVVTGNSVTFYVNGTAVVTRTITNTFSAQAATIQAWNIDAVIDNVVIARKSFTATEIAALASGSMPRSDGVIS